MSEELTARQWAEKRKDLAARAYELMCEGRNTYSWCGVAASTAIRMGVMPRSKAQQTGWTVQVKSNARSRWADYSAVPSRESGMGYLHQYRERVRNRHRENRFVEYIRPDTDIEALHRRIDEMFREVRGEDTDPWPHFRLIYREEGRLRAVPEDGSPLPPLRPRQETVGSVEDERRKFEELRERIVRESWRAANSHGQQYGVHHLLRKLPEVRDLLPELWVLELKQGSKWEMHSSAATDQTGYWSRCYRHYMGQLRVAHYPAGRKTPKRKQLVAN